MSRACVLALASLAVGLVFSAAEDKLWWQTALVYQIYPRSFKDSDGDGIGDLNGITEKLPYLHETGVDVVWLSPIYRSPMYDFGYDITDYREIAPEYGTMKDFERLLNETRRLGMRLILDFVPNHTSNESDWFVKSANREAEYEDYYVWADGRADPEDDTKLLPPNNWVSIFRKSAWEYNAAREQYYLHQFVIGQPDLNYRSSLVVEEMKNVLRFWLDKGVSGFRVDAINMMFEVDPVEHDGKYPDEPLSNKEGAGPDDYDYLNHIYTKDLDPTYDMVYQWRQLVNEFTQSHGEQPMMLYEAYTDIHLMMRYYGNGSHDGGVPFNFDFLGNIDKASSARDMKLIVDKWLTYMPDRKTANWVNGNHDNSRMVSKNGVERADTMNMLALLLPDIALTYQGEELAMTDGEVSWEETLDPQACNTDDPENYWRVSRDPARTPYQWDATAHAGFSNTTSKTWLPVASNYRTVNLAAQQKATKSHYKFYKQLASIRKSEAVRLGDTTVLSLSDNVIVVARIQPGEPAVVGVANLGSFSTEANLSALRTLPQVLTVVASGVYCNLGQGAKVNKSSVTLSPHATLVLRSYTAVPDLDKNAGVVSVASSRYFLLPVPIMLLRYLDIM